MLERLLKICGSEQINGHSVQRFYVEHINDEGEAFISKYGDTFMGKCFDIHPNDAKTICDIVPELVFASQVTHPNIVPLLGYFFLGRQVILIYEEPESSIIDHISDDVEDILEIISQMVEAISYIHSLRIVHGNIEPYSFSMYYQGESQNCIAKLIFDSNAVLIPINKGLETDFKMYSLKHRPLECCYEGQTHGFASDIWALGCTIFKLMYKTDIFPEQASEEAHISCLESWKRGVKNVFGNGVEIPAGWKKLENFTLNHLILKTLNPDENLRPNIFQIKNEIRRIKDEVRELKQMKGSPDCVSFLLESRNERFDRKERMRECSYNTNTLLGRLRNELLRRLENKNYEIKSVIMIIYGMISPGFEFRETIFNLSVKIAKILMGNRNIRIECNEYNNFIKYMRENSSPPFSFSEYYS